MTRAQLNFGKRHDDTRRHGFSPTQPEPPPPPLLHSRSKYKICPIDLCGRCKWFVLLHCPVSSSSSLFPLLDNNHSLLSSTFHYSSCPGEVCRTFSRARYQRTRSGRSCSPCAPANPAEPTTTWLTCCVRNMLQIRAVVVDLYLFVIQYSSCRFFSRAPNSSINYSQPRRDVARPRRWKERWFGHGSRHGTNEQK